MAEYCEDIEEVVNEIDVISSDLDDETEQQTMEFLNQLQEMTSDTITLGKQIAWRFRQTADTLDDLWENCKKVHIVGTAAGMVGGILTVGGGIATVLLAGAATPLLLFGIGFGFAGASTNIVASFIEAAINSKEIKKAENDLQKTLGDIRNMDRNLQGLKTSDRLSIGVDLLHFVRRLTPNGVALFCASMAELEAAGIVGIEATAQAVAQATAKAGAEATAKAGTQGTAKAGAQATAKAGAQLADDVAGAAAKAGAQAADDVAGAGAKAGVKFMGKVIIGVSVAFLVWDAIDLGYSINDLVEKKGSNAAKVLRAKADQLDNICSVS